MSGFNFGALLDTSIGAYSEISKARIERDAARYNAQPQIQQNELHAPEGKTPSEAYATGNAPNPAFNSVGGYFDRIPKPLLYGSMGLLGVALVIKALK